jgi:hypothetical protein
VLPTASLPADVEALIARWKVCRQRLEEASAEGDGRVGQAPVQEACGGLFKETAELRERYAGDAKVLEALRNPVE